MKNDWIPDKPFPSRKYRWAQAHMTTSVGVTYNMHSLTRYLIRHQNEYFADLKQNGLEVTVFDYTS